MSMSASQQQSVDPPDSRRRLRILHLEDSPLDAELVAAHLEEGGVPCGICVVDTGQAFAAEAARAEVDLILADYSLPSFDGMSALRIAQRVCPEVPFLFVSGAIGEIGRASCRERV